MKKLINQTVGQYKITGEIGKGGMAVVYRARQVSLDRDIALKILHPSLIHDNIFVKRFIQEARSAAKMNHPNIVTIYEVGEANSVYYMAMPYIKGRSLAEMLTQGVAPNQLVKIVSQIANALDYAHQQGIIHRDVKPGNILVTTENYAFLTDFGIAKAAAQSNNLTRTGTMVGTPTYMAPEQAKGQQVVPQTDQYALGIIAYEGLTGRPPFVSNRSHTILFKHIDDPPDLSMLPPPYQAVLQRVLAKKPQQRFATAAEFAQALQNAAYEYSAVSTSGLGPAQSSVAHASTGPATPAPSGNFLRAATSKGADGTHSTPLPDGSQVVYAAQQPAKKQLSAWIWAGGAMVIVIIFTVLFFFLMGNSRRTAIINSEATTSDVTEVKEAETVQPTPPPASATATSAKTGDGTATVQDNETAAQDAIPSGYQGASDTLITPTVVATATTTPISTRTPARQSATPTSISTATPMSIATPNTTPTKTVAPKPAGPTVIPLQSDITIPQIGQQQVTDVTINPQNPNEVYALVKGDGLYKSSQGGERPWARINLDGSGITMFTLDPHNPAQIYAASWNAVLKSTDGGNSWKAFGNGLSNANRAVDVVVPDPETPNLLYAGIGATLIVSTDGGESWQSDEFGHGLTGGRLTSIAINPFNNNVVYVGGEFGSLYKSVDSGRTFAQLSFHTGSGTFSLAAHPTKKDVVLAGINSYDAGIIKTENGSDFYSVSRGLIFGGADSAYSAIAFAPGNPDIIYAGSGYENDGYAKGIFKSNDGGESWQNASDGLRINPTTGYPHYVKSLAVHPTDINIVFAATGYGLYKSVDGGASWVLK